MAAQFDKMLVLDLDETLVHSVGFGFEEERSLRDAHFHVDDGDIGVYRRPGVEEFLDWCLEKFAAVGIWTAGTLSYAQELVPYLCDPDALEFLWGRERCGSRRDLETQETNWVKDIRKLRKLGYARSQILCVDDTPENFARSYGNYIYMRPFEGDPEDDMLPRLRRYLETLGPVPNVRAVEKRGWQLRSPA